MIIPIPTKLFICGKIFYSKISDNFSSKFLNDDGFISIIQDDFNSPYKFQHPQSWFMFAGFVSLFVIFNSNIFKFDSNTLNRLKIFDLLYNIKHFSNLFCIFLTIIMIVFFKNVEPVL